MATRFDFKTGYHQTRRKNMQILSQNYYGFDTKYADNCAYFFTSFVIMVF